MPHRLSRLLFVPAALVFCTLPAVAAITGSISGRVTDASGAVIPDAQVTAVNQDTGIRQTVATNNEGFYIFSALSIGRYKVNVTRTGFNDFQATDVKVDANSALRIEAMLVAGSVSVIEEVNANALQVETQNTQLGEVIESEKITSVPLNGRAFTDLLALQPGVSPYSGTTESGRTVSGGLNPGIQSVNGGREASNGYMINGADANEGVYNGAAIIPNLDSIAEFRIITNNFDAEYGNFSGGQINVVTKSGTNSFHGDVFDFLRNTDLDAANYFNAGQRGTFIQNIFGGVVGGPIKRDKAFFFADFQGTKQIRGNTQNFAVPTAANRSGIFDASGSSPLIGSTVQGSSWAQMLSQRLGYTVTQGEAYFSPGCADTVTCVFPNATIPRAAWSSAAVGLLPLVPQANSGSSFFQTSAFSARLADYKGGIRADLNTRFGNIFAYYFLDDFANNDPYSGGSTVPGYNSIDAGRAQMINLGLTNIHGPSVNDFRFSYLRDVNHLGTPGGGTGVSLGSLGFVTPFGSNGGIGNISSSLIGVPTVNFNNFTLGTPVDNLGQFNNSFQFLDNFSHVVGNHSLKFGANYHYDQINERNFYAANGQFGFNGQETGSDFADFLLGAPNEFIQASAQILDSRSQYVGIYAEDSWRVSLNLTVNYGLRYEISTPWYDTQNKLEAIIPGVQSVVFPGAPKGYLVPGDPGVSRTLAPIRYNNFAPRFGIAFSPGSSNSFLDKLTGGGNRFSIRAGYGLFYTNIQDATGFVEVGDAPFGLFYVSPAPPILETPYIDRATGNNEGQRFPFTFPSTNVSAKNPNTTFNWAGVLPISGAPVFDVHNVLPYTQSFYLSTQREFGKGTVATLNYVGTVGRKLITQVEANPGNAALCQSIDQAAVGPNGTPCGPNLENTVFNLTNGQTVNGTRTILGNDFGSNPYMQTSATSSYNSLQASLQHTSTRYDFLLGYTFSRSFDDGSGQADNTNFANPRLSRGLSNFDVTHNFVGSYTIQLPFDLIPGDNALAKAIKRGWSVSGITTLASGLPITLSETDDQSLTGTGGVDRPNYTLGKLLADTNPRHNQPYFNTTLFTQEDLGTFGSSHRRFFHGPGLNNTDLALLRKFQVHESVNVQFRAEAFNVFNHAQFSTPSGNWNNSGPGGFGYVTSTSHDPRIMQVALKLNF